ncbi:Isochorismatase hydrolase [Polyplosphaeria fusca]|uniref:Isochorismatase hydrolase n=1 Tax=Polyplosphaeria fusca TaxID=682080 RepID=A0A9P4UXU7_9PLEO|nr:Isochorismatase hydrolase [Polyplosphaeria fusca]
MSVASIPSMRLALAPGVRRPHFIDAPRHAAWFIAPHGSMPIGMQFSMSTTGLDVGKHSHPQIFTQHGHPPSDFSPPITNQLIKKWGLAASIRIDSPDWQLLPDIAALRRDDDAIVLKNTYDGFIGTDLKQRLRDLGVERVVICGVITDVCCATTGRSAFCRGFETWLVRDAMGSTDEKRHEAVLKEWGFAFGDVGGY